MASLIDPADAAARLGPDWRALEGRAAIARTFRFATFDRAFAFMTAVAATASALDHHPEWSNVYGRVEVLLTTHSAGGVTEKDLILARAMEAAAGEARSS